MQHLTDKQRGELKEKLEEEKRVVFEELSHIGRKNPSNPADWEAKPDEMEIQEADRNEAADRIESFEENTAILKELETRYNTILEALARTEAGTYGICEVGNEPISVERLYANPAALTCLNHLKQTEN